ncbi:hypothetical protein EYB25_009974 [Talaromyces marneffei]|nr:hypothetical protein EYB25_009974 [Talaromyces marneffei]
MTGRIGKPKSRTGCDTCKIRRIRCTEEHPQCSKCTSTGRKCTYTDSIFKHQHNQRPPIKPLNLPVGALSNPTSRERRCFEYYFHTAAPSLSGSLDHPFWSVHVLQLCRTEPAIWDGIISLSALFERHPLTDESKPTALISAPVTVKYEYHQDALAWYSRSLAGLRQRISRSGMVDMNLLLVGTIIYIAIELLQANYEAVLGLYTRGIQLVANGLAESGLKRVVKAMFRRLRTQVLIFSGMSIEDDIPDQPVVNDFFESIDEARNALFEMTSDMKQLLLAIKSFRAQTGSLNIPASHPLATRQAQLEYRLHHWHDNFTSSPLTLPLQKGDITITTLLMNHTSILLETQTCLNSDETAYDLHKHAFEKILDYADTISSSSSSSSSSVPPPVAAAGAISHTTIGERQPFSFELGSFLPLFITALKCRFPDLRRRAIHLLSSPNAATANGSATEIQGMFLCRPAAQLVAIIVGLEEGSYPPSDTPLNQPDQRTKLDHSVRVADDILTQEGCIPSAERRICDFWVSSQSEAEMSPPRPPFSSGQRKKSQLVDGDGRRKNESWLHYRRYVPLPLPFQDADDEDARTGKEMVYVTRTIRIPDRL